MKSIGWLTGAVLGHVRKNGAINGDVVNNEVLIYQWAQICVFIFIMELVTHIPAIELPRWGYSSATQCLSSHGCRGYNIPASWSYFTSTNPYQPIFTEYDTLKMG